VGDNLVFWVGDKAIGGKMFCLVNLSGGTFGVVSYSAGPERYAELLERDGLLPAPYMARIHWISAERWSAWRNAEWESELRTAHAITFAKLPKRTCDVLAMSATARKKLISERRKLLQQNAAEKSARKK
jgi:predicted DNA-binding protein (MmcQ/YjbR family)